jgi:hypothetical protein
MYLAQIFSNLTQIADIGIEVLTAVVVESTIYWDIMPCGPLKVNRHLEGTCHLHLQS